MPRSYLLILSDNDVIIVGLGTQHLVVCISASSLANTAHVILQTANMVEWQFVDVTLDCYSLIVKFMHTPAVEI